MTNWKEYATKELNFNPLEMSEYIDKDKESSNTLYLCNSGPTSVYITYDGIMFKASVFTENTYIGSVRTNISASIIEVLIEAIKGSFKYVDKWEVEMD